MDSHQLQRIALVTPYAWSVPHPVNDHVAELATGLCERAQAGERTPEVVVIAPTLDTRARRSTRRALREIARGDDVAGVLLADDLLAPQPGVRAGSRDEPLDFPLLALGLAIGPASVALRSSLRLLMERGGFDLVHAHDPWATDLVRFVVRHWPGLTTATFHSVPSKSVLESMASGLRERIIDQLDATFVPGDAVATALADAGVGLGEPRSIATIAADDTSRRPGPGTWRTVVAGRDDEDDAALRDMITALEPLATDDKQVELVLTSRWDNHHRPREPKAWRGRIHNARPTSRGEGYAVLERASAFIWNAGVHPRAALEAAAASVPVITAGDGSGEQDLLPSVAAVLAAGDAGTTADAAPVLPAGLVAPAATRTDLAEDHLTAWLSLTEKVQVHIPPPSIAERTCVIDMHMHTSHSWDCATDPEALLFAAREVGLTAVCVTDHNEVSGGLACAELADEYGIQVVVGEEVKTAEGEVIGLFLTERIEPGLSWEETIRLIRAQDGLVYVPHPFDRLHTIPSAATLRDTVDEIDAFEVYNARLAFEQYNRDAQRFARKYNLIEGAGSDAHVPQGLGTGAVHMPAWDDRENFLTALRQGEILRRPKNLLYIQGLKWINDMTGKSKGSPAEQPSG